MRTILLFLFLLVFNFGIGVSKKKYPEFWAKNDTLFRILWTVVSLLLMGFIGWSLWYLFAKTSLDAGTKVFNGLILVAFLILFGLLNVFVWKKKK